jgi:hypothetical protein
MFAQTTDEPQLRMKLLQKSNLLSGHRGQTLNILHISRRINNRTMELLRVRLGLPTIIHLSAKGV